MGWSLIYSLFFWIDLLENPSLRCENAWRGLKILHLQLLLKCLAQVLGNIFVRYQLPNSITFWLCFLARAQQRRQTKQMRREKPPTDMGKLLLWFGHVINYQIAKILQLRKNEVFWSKKIYRCDFFSGFCFRKTAWPSALDKELFAIKQKRMAELVINLTVSNVTICCLKWLLRDQRVDACP